MRCASQIEPRPTVVVTFRVAGRPLAGIDETRLGGLEPHPHVAGGTEQQVALLGEDEPAGMAVEEGRAQLALERADLAADGGLAQAQVLTGAREAASFRDGVENPDLVPIHDVFLVSSARVAGRVSMSCEVVPWTQ